MTRYRKKPVVIDAWRFEPVLDRDAWKFPARPDWLLESKARFALDIDSMPIIIVPSLEGLMTANAGDWIIRGIQGGLYPCKPDIFAASYEAAE